jgi:hypothetical protein
MRARFGRSEAGGTRRRRSAQHAVYRGKIVGRFGWALVSAPGYKSHQDGPLRNRNVSLSVSTGQMTVAGAVRGVILRPRNTFEALRHAPQWAAVLVLTTTVSAISWAILYSTETGRIALVDQWERAAFAVGRAVDDTGYERLRRISANGVQYSLGRALVLGPVVTFAVAGVVLLAARRLSPVGARPTFEHGLAVTAHAGVILALRDAVGAPLAYVRETTASASTLGIWLPLLDEASIAARFAGSLDVFVLWWAALVGIGTAVLCGRSTRRSAAAAMGTFAAGAGVVAAALGLMRGGS